MKLYFLLIISLFFVGCEADEDASASNEDWKHLSSPTSIDLTDVFFVDADNGFIAGRSLDSIHTSIFEDRGDPLSWLRWLDQPHIITDSTRYYQKMIVATVPTEPEPSFFKTSDGGTTWTEVSRPFVSDIADIFFVNSQYGFVATQHEGVYKTTDGGATWTKVLDDIIYLGDQRRIENPYTKLYFTDEARGFAFHHRENVFIKTNDGGESWGFVPGFEGLSTLGFNKLLFPQGTQTGYAHGMGGFLKSEDGGESWKRVNSVDAPTEEAQSLATKVRLFLKLTKVRPTGVLCQRIRL